MHELGYPCVQCAAVYLIYYILNVHLYQTGFLTLNTINIFWVLVDSILTLVETYHRSRGGKGLIKRDWVLILWLLC